VVFTDSKYIQPDLIRKFNLFDQIPQTLRCANRKARVVEGGCEAINSNLNL
jgi:hypothetical protein